MNHENQNIPAEATELGARQNDNDEIGKLSAQKAAYQEQLGQLQRQFMADEISGSEKTLQGQYIEAQISMIDLQIQEALKRVDAPVGTQRQPRKLGRLAAHLFKRS